MKQKITIVLIFIFISIAFFQACKEDLPNIEDAATNKIELNLTYTDVEEYSISLTCNIINNGNSDISKHGICWNILEEPTLSDSKLELGVLDSIEFIANMDNLEPSMNYYIKAYVVTNEIVLYSDQIIVRTDNETLYTEINEDFSSVENNVDISIADWLNISETGETVWVGEIYGDSKYAMMTSYFSSDANCISWLLTPLIDFDENPNEILSFKSSQGWWTHDGLSVWLITDINGKDLESAKKEQLTVTLADENTPDFDWIESGAIDLSLYTGIGRIGFRYEGSRPEGETGEFYLDNVVITNELDYSFVTDIDGNTYRTIQIGNQVWMAENLKTTHYADGRSIPLVTDNTAWGNLGDNGTDDAYSFYNNDANSQFGALYTWAAAMGDDAVSSSSNPSGLQGACPDDWHLPSDAEWAELVNFIAADGYSGHEGTALKSTSGWNSDGNGTDIYGFNGLPGGYRHSDASFYGAGDYGNWWSSTEYNTDSTYCRSLHSIYHDLYQYKRNKSNGFSIRCVKD